jgi:signal recognition particle subunit SRP54
MGMVPGMNRLKQMKNMPKPDEKELGRIEAVINSMTAEERQRYKIINSSRRQRIARGSGTKVQDVNKVIKSYSDMLKMMKKMKGMGAFGGGGGAAVGKKRRKRPKGLFR